jgi:nucleoside 2-deoxyribosyltransferase
MQKMKIYFCGSIRGGRQLASTYQRIIALLKADHQVLTEHLGDDNEIESKDRILSDRQIHDRDMDWIRQSDLVVAEVTIPSLGVGYEIGRAIELKIPVLCLFDASSDKNLSAMIAGSERVENHRYHDLDDLKDAVQQFITAHALHRTS